MLRDAAPARQIRSDNRKRVYRVYRLLKLNLRRRKGKRRLPDRIKQPLEQQTSINQVWAMDFMSDSLACGSKVRTLNLMDEGSREGLTSHRSSLIHWQPKSHPGVGKSDRSQRRKAQGYTTRQWAGVHFCSVAFTAWCKEQQIAQVFIQKGRPMQHGYMERFNGSFRKEVLDMYLFTERWQAQEHADKWLQHYNTQRPHEGLNNKTPREWAAESTLLLGGGTPAQPAETPKPSNNLYFTLVVKTRH